MEAAQQASHAGISVLPSAKSYMPARQPVLDAASLGPCARRALGRRLCPNAPAPGADTFPLGCVPSAPPAPRAPCVLSVTHFALSMLRSTADAGAEAEIILRGLRSLAETGAEAQSTLQSLRATARSTGYQRLRKDAQSRASPRAGTPQEPDRGLHISAQTEPDLRCNGQHLGAVPPQPREHDSSFLAAHHQHTRHATLADADSEMLGATTTLANIAASDTAMSPKPPPQGGRPPTPRRHARAAEGCMTVAKSTRAKSTTPHLARGSTSCKSQLPVRQRLQSGWHTEDLGSCLPSKAHHRSRMLARMPSTVRSLSLDSHRLATTGSQSVNVDCAASAMVLDLHRGVAHEVAATKPCTTSFVTKGGQRNGWLPQIQSARELPDPAWRSSLDTSLRPHRSRLRSVY